MRQATPYSQPWRAESVRGSRRLRARQQEEDVLEGVLGGVPRRAARGRQAPRTRGPCRATSVAKAACSPAQKWMESLFKQPPGRKPRRAPQRVAPWPRMYGSNAPARFVSVMLYPRARLPLVKPHDTAFGSELGANFLVAADVAVDGLCSLSWPVSRLPCRSSLPTPALVTAGTIVALAEILAVGKLEMGSGIRLLHAAAHAGAATGLCPRRQAKAPPRRLTTAASASDLASPTAAPARCVGCRPRGEP